MAEDLTHTAGPLADTAAETPNTALGPPGSALLDEMGPGGMGVGGGGPGGGAGVPKSAPVGRKSVRLAHSHRLTEGLSIFVEIWKPIGYPAGVCDFRPQLNTAN
jgi:hypothetical protein